MYMYIHTLCIDLLSSAGCVLLSPKAPKQTETSDAHSSLTKKTIPEGTRRASSANVQLLRL